MTDESKERTDLATAIRSLAAEEFSLSRHYEQVQYALLAAFVGACGFIFSQRLAFSTASILFRWTATIGILLYQLPYLLTVLAQMRRVMEARRSGVLISLFHASQQASTMAL